jgi:putative transposase
MAIPQEPNQRWSLDFVSDALSDSRRFRILCVIDDFSRECLAAVVDNSISGERVTRELDRLAATRGYPCMIVSDNVLRRQTGLSRRQSISSCKIALAA